MLETLGELWLAGARVNWTGFYQHEQRRRVPLPTYPFERKRHWLERSQNTPAPVQPRSNNRKNVSLLERVMSEQIDLMTHQLELLRNPQQSTLRALKKKISHAKTQSAAAFRTHLRICV